MDQPLAPLGLVRRPAHSLSASAECLALIRHFETFAPRKYYCPAGMPTIGYGHVILLHEVHLHTATLSPADAEALLRADVGRVERALWVLVRAPVAQREYDALVSLAFNTGPGKADGKKGDFADSTLLDLVNRGEYAAASPQFDRWVYSKGRRMNGLVRRRHVERALYEGRDWRATDAVWLAQHERGR